MADPTSIDTLTNLGGTGAIVVAFLWYLKSRDAIMEKMLDKVSISMSEMGDKLEKLADAIGGLDSRIREVESRQDRRRRRTQQS